MSGTATAMDGAAAPADPVRVEFTEDGSLRLDADSAALFFPSDALVAVPQGDELWLMPLVGPEGGGLLLKQRNVRGDRSTLIWERSRRRRISRSGSARPGGTSRTGHCVSPSSDEPPTERNDEAGAVETFVREEAGRWIVDIAVAFPDGVVRAG